MSRTKLLERTEMVIRYDVTNLSKDEIDALEDEARAVGRGEQGSARVGRCDRRRCQVHPDPDPDGQTKEETMIKLAIIAIAISACTPGDNGQACALDPGPAPTCESYELAPDVPSCSVIDMRSDLAAPSPDDVLSFSGPIDPSALGPDHVRVLDVYRDPITGEPGGRFTRRDGSCGFVPCLFEYVDVSTTIGHCGDPPNIPDTDVTIDNGIASMPEAEWNELTVFEDRYAAWAECVLRAARPQ